MKSHPSPPSPRRRTPGAASRPLLEPKSGAGKAPGRGESPLKAGDVGSKRRALKKRRARQGNWAAWTIAAAITVVLAGAGAGIWEELGTAKARVAQKRATLADLSAQLESGQRRLRALTSSSGRERVLVENGFIKPGERLLLFPKNPVVK